MREKTESYTIHGFNGRITCWVPGLKLIDFYRSSNPPPAVAQSPTTVSEAASKRENKMFKGTKR